MCVWMVATISSKAKIKIFCKFFFTPGPPSECLPLEKNPKMLILAFEANSVHIVLPKCGIFPRFSSLWILLKNIVSSKKVNLYFFSSSNCRCTCDSTHRCVLTDNWQDRRAYVFQCRNRESSNHMFPFPDRK